LRDGRRGRRDRRAAGLAIDPGALTLAERGLAKAAAAATPARGRARDRRGWVLVCYAPFHPLPFRTPLHEPITLHAGDPSLPITIPRPVAGRST
jgi:hypothetical protein